MKMCKIEDLLIIGTDYEYNHKGDTPVRKAENIITTAAEIRSLVEVDAPATAVCPRERLSVA